MRVLFFIRKIFKKFPLLLSVNSLLLLMTSFIEAASLFSLVMVVDFFLNPGLNGASRITRQAVAVMSLAGLPVTLGWFLAVFLFFSTLKVSFQIFAQYSILRTKYAVLRDIMLGTFEDFFNARWYFFSSGKQGVLVNTFLREITIVGDAFGAMARYFSIILQIILYLAVPFILSWQIASISMACALIFVLPFFMLGRFSYRLGQLNTSTANSISSVIQEGLNSAKVILGFGNQARSTQELKTAFDAHRRASVRSQTLTFAMPLMYYPFGLLVLAISLFVARRIQLPLAETAVLFYSLTRLIPFIGSLTEEKNRLDNFFPSYEQVMSLRQRARELKQPSGSKIFSGFNKEIIVDGLSFAYPGHGDALTDINMRIPKSRMVALVGGSGAGKSTLIDMIMGFNIPRTGRILFDGVDLNCYQINSYRRRIGYVPQDSVLFNMSVRDNLLWASEGAGEKEIRAACSLANAQEFIARLPKGYDTLIGDRGVRLSGGQIQRIALARAILRKPELLILDEATSALDTHSERLIQQAIETVVKETTVIVVAHRLSTVINAHYIYVLKNARIIEEGTYPELIKKSGHFNEMIQLQSLKGNG